LCATLLAIWYRRPASEDSSRLSRILTFTINYGFNLLTLLGAAVAVLASIVSPSLNLALPAIFSILAIIVFDQIIQDHTYRRPGLILLNKISSERRASGSVDDLLTAQIPFDAALATAQSLEIVTNTLARTLTSHSAVLSRMLERGGTFKAVIMDHEGDQAALLMAAFRSDDNVNSFRFKLENTRTQLRRLHKKTKTGGLQLRVSSIAPSFGVYIIDRNLHTACLYLRIFAHYVPLDSNPTLSITKSDSPHAFAIFAEQFDKIYEKSRAIDLEAEPAKEISKGV
jgi:hypothetical protein